MWELLDIKTYHSANSYLEKLTNLFVRVNFFYKPFAINVLKQQNLYRLQARVAEG